MLAPAEHVRSWYAATVRPELRCPHLEGSQRADVAIVGGGFTGVSAALFLAERGVDVALVEANRIGWGASGRNGGQLIDGFVAPGKLAARFGPEAETMAHEMGIECRDIVVDRIERYAIDCDLKFGYLDVAVTAKELRALDEFYTMRARRGYPHELRIVTRGDLPEYVGSDYYLGGGINMGNGHLHPLNLCVGEARAAAGLGARLFEQSPVTRVVNGPQPSVETARGVVHADKIILAGNAYLGRTEPRLRGRVIPAGSFVMATEPLGEARARALIPKDMACCEERIGLNYFRLSPDRRLLFGGACNYSGTVPKNIEAALRPRLRRIFPGLDDVRIDYQWGGDIGISLNRIPQFGRIEGNTFYAQGWSGHGLAPTHLAGKLLADAITGDSARFDLFSRVRHWRLPGGKWFANPALALGMLYFRARELL